MSVIYEKRPYVVIVNGIRLPGMYNPQAFWDSLKLKVKSDDVVLVSFPRSGTNWTQQIIQLLRNNGKPSETYQEYRKGCPLIEMNGTISVEEQDSPRFYRTHIPYNMLPKSADAKYIWVVRNPKDCLVSLYHLTASRLLNFVDGSFDEFFDSFMEGKTMCNDIFDHLMAWYEHRNDPNVLQIYYEDMQTDLKGAVLKIAKFLGTLYDESIKDEALLNDILYYSSFEYMEKTLNTQFEKDEGRSVSIGAGSLPTTPDNTNKFKRATNDVVPGVPKLVRQGKVGSWKNVFSEEQNRRMNEKIEDRLKDTELLEFWKTKNCL